MDLSLSRVPRKAIPQSSEIASTHNDILEVPLTKKSPGRCLHPRQLVLAGLSRRIYTGTSFIDEAHKLLGRIATLVACFALFTNLLLVSCSSVGDTAARRKPPASPESIQIRVAEKGLEVHWKEVPGATHYTIFWGTETGQ